MVNTGTDGGYSAPVPTKIKITYYSVPYRCLKYTHDFFKTRIFLTTRRANQTMRSSGNKYKEQKAAEDQIENYNRIKL